MTGYVRETIFMFCVCVGGEGGMLVTEGTNTRAAFTKIQNLFQLLFVAYQS